MSVSTKDVTCWHTDSFMQGCLTKTMETIKSPCFIQLFLIILIFFIFAPFFFFFFPLRAHRISLVKQRSVSIYSNSRSLISVTVDQLRYTKVKN